MKQATKNMPIFLYNILVVSLALVSFVLAVLALVTKITLNEGPYRVIFGLIWLFFLIDYLIRFKRAKSKKDFLISNLFDLIALIPSHPIFIFFRIARIYSIVRYYNLLWRFGLSGKLTNALHKFLYDTGFIYLLSISLVILIFSSLIFASFEHDSLQNSLWWAISTAATVGYGDITPKTDGGKIISAVLMLGGIGFIGLLTSTITDFFTSQDKHSDETDALKDLTKQVTRLSRQVNQLQKELKKEAGPKKLPTAKNHQKNRRS